MIKLHLLHRTIAGIGSALLLSGILASEAMAQVTITVSSPANRAVIRPRELTSIAGTVSGGAPTANVKIAISRHGSDLEWAKDDRGNYRWLHGPTGQWLGTLSSRGTRWSAPSARWTLPSGSDLPDGKYVITTMIESHRGGQQFRSNFTVKRTLEDLVQDNPIRPR